MSSFFLRCPRCEFLCAKTVHVCTMCGASLHAVPPDPWEAYLPMTNAKRLEAIHRLYQVAVAHGQTHTLAEVVAFFDDRLTGGRTA